MRRALGKGERRGEMGAREGWRRGATEAVASRLDPRLYPTHQSARNPLATQSLPLRSRPAPALLIAQQHDALLPLLRLLMGGGGGRNGVAGNREKEGRGLNMTQKHCVGFGAALGRALRQAEGPRGQSGQRALRCCCSKTATWTTRLVHSGSERAVQRGGGWGVGQKGPHHEARGRQVENSEVLREALLSRLLTACSRKEEVRERCALQRQDAARRGSAAQRQLWRAAQDGAGGAGRRGGERARGDEPVGAEEREGPPVLLPGKVSLESERSGRRRLSEESAGTAAEARRPERLQKASL